MPLYLVYTMGQKSQKWPKTQIKGGPALIQCELSKGRGGKSPVPTVHDWIVCACVCDGGPCNSVCANAKKCVCERKDVRACCRRCWQLSRKRILFIYILILKTIGNRKGDCAWSCSRWQAQPEKICKSQRTNQCHHQSLRTLYWFVLCNLQIFSGCACHLEQLHAQSPFLFPIVFSINLIPFFDICSVLAVPSLGLFGYVLLYFFTWAFARSQQLLFVALAAGLWCFTAGCHVKSPVFPQPPRKQKCVPRWEKA